LGEAFPDADTVSAVFFPYGLKQTFCSDGDPAFRAWDDTQAEYALKDIVMNADSSVSFTVIRPIESVNQTVFQNAAILSWQIDESLLGEIDSCTVEISSTVDEPIIEKVMPGESGRLTVTPSALSQSTVYSTLTTVYTPDAVYSKSGSFKTLMVDNRNTIPFIFLFGVDRNKDGSFNSGAKFPLYVYNATEAEEINWYFGDSKAELGEDGYFTVTTSGMLRAEILNKDGTTDVIVKQITVK